MNLVMFENIKKHYGKYSSWLIYEKDCRDYGCIERRKDEINLRFAFCALNAACETEHYWQPFHVVYPGGRAWILRDVLGMSPVFKGSYITDLIKGSPTKKAREVMNDIRFNRINKNKHVDIFIREIEELKLKGKIPTIIVFGKDAMQIFQTESKLAIFKNNVEYITHYSARGKYILRFRDEIKSLEQRYA